MLLWFFKAGMDRLVIRAVSACRYARHALIPHSAPGPDERLGPSPTTVSEKAGLGGPGGNNCPEKPGSTNVCKTRRAETTGQAGRERERERIQKQGRSESRRYASELLDNRTAFAPAHGSRSTGTVSASCLWEVIRLACPLTLGPWGEGRAVHGLRGGFDAATQGRARMLDTSLSAVSIWHACGCCGRRSIFGCDTGPYRAGDLKGAGTGSLVFPPSRAVICLSHLSSCHSISSIHPSSAKSVHFSTKFNYCPPRPPCLVCRRPTRGC